MSSDEQAKPRMYLELQRGENRGKQFPIEEGSNLIGRWDPDSGAFPEIDLEEEDVDAKMSRKHAEIFRQGDVATIQDLESLNGTFVNRGDRIAPDQKVTLSNGDEIVLGKIFMKFVVEE